MGGFPFVTYDGDIADLASHIAVPAGDLLPDLFAVVSSRPVKPGWRAPRPAEVEVVVNDANGDVVLRDLDGELIGSLARTWAVGMGMHPFVFPRQGHSPRLVVGKVVVQREAWTVCFEELETPPFEGVAPSLLVSVEKLRRARGIPRRVYTRPTGKALSRTGAGGRDKDVKPVFADLESYLFVDSFYRRLKDYGELEVVEMLPTPGLWRERDGAYSFELRTLITPR